MNIIQNIRTVFYDRRSYLVAIISSLVMLNIILAINGYARLLGIMNYRHVWINIGIEILISLFFGINIAILRFQILNSNLSKNLAGSTTIGSMLAVILTGCPMCGLTLASYMGIASVLSSLPFKGIEIKVLGLLIVIISTWIMLRRGFECRVPVKISE